MTSYDAGSGKAPASLGITVAARDAELQTSFVCWPCAPCNFRGHNYVLIITEDRQYLHQQIKELKSPLKHSSAWPSQPHPPQLLLKMD
jgi:hypothetical protein